MELSVRDSALDKPLPARLDVLLEAIFLKDTTELLGRGTGLRREGSRRDRSRRSCSSQAERQEGG